MCFGISLSTLFTVLLILKIVGVGISWWVVTAPIWFPPVVALGIVMCGFIAAAFMSRK